MALSQKHSGKILVPWYNSHEWKHVYQLIYSENSNKSDKEKAVEILKIWKIRMPILFAGLEGTLIILNAMLLDGSLLPKEELTYFYGLAIMRFLNLCAAHSDQQGTFFRVAKEKKLPEWLVNIRHDLAHSQKQLSLFMLQKGLEYCFRWLKKEYWEPQDREIMDFVICERNTEDNNEKIKLYCEYVISTVVKKKLSPAIVKMLKANKHSPPSNILRNVLISNNVNIKSMCDLIIDNGYLFEIPSTEDLSQIPVSYIKAWEPLIQYIQENSELITLIKKFHSICGDESNDDCKVKKLSSLWLNEIFESLLKVEKMNDSSKDEEHENYIMTLCEPSKQFICDLKTFVEEAMETPHAHLQDYFTSLMSLCAYNPQFINHVSSLLANYFYPHNDLELMYSSPMTLEDINALTKTDVVEKLNSISEEIKPVCNKRWQKIEDTDIYAGYPIGVLPNQNGNVNPTISF